jgi:hypothetical protein
VTPIGDHTINEWTDRDGTLLGASIFLTAEEVRQLKNGDPVTIHPD